MLGSEFFVVDTFEILQDSFNLLNGYQIWLITINFYIFMHILKFPQHNLHELFDIVRHVLITRYFYNSKENTFDNFVDYLLIGELLGLVILQHVGNEGWIA